MDPLKFGSVQHRVINAICKDDKTDNLTQKLKSALKNLIKDWNHSNNHYTLSHIIASFIKEYIDMDIDKTYKIEYVKSMTHTIAIRATEQDVLNAFSGWVSHLDTLEKICDEIGVEPYVLKIKVDEPMNEFSKDVCSIIDKFLSFGYIEIQDPNAIFGGAMLLSKLKSESSKFYDSNGEFIKINPKSLFFYDKPYSLAVKFFNSLSKKEKTTYKKMFVKLNSNEDYSDSDSDS